MNTNLSLVTAWFEEVWNQGNEAAIDKYFSPNGMAYGIAPTPLNREEFKTHYRAYRQAFPNMHIGVLETMEQGNRVSFHCIALLDKDEDPPKTVQGMGFMTVENGQVIEASNVWDFLSMLIQINELPHDSLQQGIANYCSKRLK